MDLKFCLVSFLTCIMFAYEVSSRNIFIPIHYNIEEMVNKESSGTLKTWPNFDSKAGCETLEKAMKNSDIDKEAIIEVLGYRNTDQRMDIVNDFKTIFGKDLIKEFESKLNGSFLDTCKALCLEPDIYDATEIRRAVEGLGTNEDVLIEIFSTQDNEQIKDISLAYKEEFNTSMEQDIKEDTSGHFHEFIYLLSQGNRNESLTIDIKEAKHDAQALFKAGEVKLGTDESVFIEVFSKRSYAHLRIVFEEYVKLSKYGIEGAINAEFSGDIRNSLMSMVEVIKDTPTYFAKKLQRSMKGLGTDDKALIRIMVSRCELDMVLIKKSFRQLFGTSLAEWIMDDTTGDYRKLILALIGVRIMSNSNGEK